MIYFCTILIAMAVDEFLMKIRYQIEDLGLKQSVCIPFQQSIAIITASGIVFRTYETHKFFRFPSEKWSLNLVHLSYMVYCL